MRLRIVLLLLLFELRVCLLLCAHLLLVEVDQIGVGRIDNLYQRLLYLVPLLRDPLLLLLSPPLLSAGLTKATYQAAENQHESNRERDLQRIIIRVILAARVVLVVVIVAIRLTAVVLVAIVSDAAIIIGSPGLIIGSKLFIHF